MRECMGTDKPLVSILMAVYKPNERWLREQLSSLNSQTYPNLELLIYDDCPACPLDEGIVRELITAFPFRIIRGEKNLGSNKAFERLTAEGTGMYFSYCDQDDVWYSQKVQRMTEVLESTGSPMVCSDLAIINAKGKRISDSITKVRKRHIFYDGDNVASYLLVKNFVTGCAMMMRSDVAKRSIPFVDSLIHDHWLAINAALSGKIEIIREPLIDYRQHDSNQTGVLKGVKTKQDYYDARIGNMFDRLADYKKRLYNFDNLKRTIDELGRLNEARSNYFFSHKASDRKIMREYKHYCKNDILLETFLPFMSKWSAKAAFWAIQHRLV